MKTNFRKKWIDAPHNSRVPSQITGTFIYPDEEVIWTYTHTTNGSYISGYSIVHKKDDHIDEIIKRFKVD